MKKKLFKSILASISLAGMTASAAPLVYEGGEGIGKGKHIVFLANDHEYRSEETSPLLAKMLAKHQGFKCTVLFGIDEEGHIEPGSKNIPHLEVLKDADLFVCFARFLSLSDEQVQHIVDYTEKGGPVIGMRTTTHSFHEQGGSWAKLNFDYKGEDYDGGFGKQIFGNTWDKKTGQSHYGRNHTEGGTNSAVESAKAHPILRGVAPFHTYIGAYKSHPPVDATELIEVQVLNTFETSDDINERRPKVSAGWARDHYTAPSGQKKDARVVYTSIGASEDFLDANARRFLINSCLWAVGLEKEITPELNVDIVGKYEPSSYLTSSFYRTNVKPSDIADFDSNIMPENAGYAGADEKSKRRWGKVVIKRPKLKLRLKKLYPDLDLSNLEKKNKKK